MAKKKKAWPNRDIYSSAGLKSEGETLTLQLHLHMSHRQVAGLKRLAREHDRTVSYLIRSAIEAMITAEEPNNAPQPDDTPTNK